MKSKLPKLDNKIVRVPLDSVKLWKNNPRKNDAAAKHLSKLIKEHGQRTPIVVWEKDNTIYKGNTTWKAMKLLGAKYIDVIFTQFKSKGEAVKYGLADNKSGEWSEWDDDILVKLFEAEEFKGVDLDATGFTEQERNDLLPWKADLKIVGDIKENEEQVLATIKIKCPRPKKEDLMKALRKQFKNDAEVKVEG